MRSRTQHRVGSFKACAVVAVLMAACSVAGQSPLSESADQVDAVLSRADEVWSPDLDADGQADAMILTGEEIRFAVWRDGDLVEVVDDAGPVVLAVAEGVSVTCQSEGAYLQTFEPPNDDEETGPLRLYLLEIDGVRGELIPSPSFFFGSDFQLPDVGAGCPTRR